MPELSELKPWDSVHWDNMAFESGTGHLDRRAYYFRVIGSGEAAKILLISAVKSKIEAGSLHATDYLRLDRRAFQRLADLSANIFGISTSRQ